MKPKKIIEKLISRLKKESIEFNYEYSIMELIAIILSFVPMVIRGCWLKLWMGGSQGFVFVAKNVRIKFPRKIICGRNLTLKYGAAINALSTHGVLIGDNFSLGEFAMIECTGVLRDVGAGVVIGNNVGINHYCYIAPRGNIEIGDNVIFGPRVNVFSENHNFSNAELPIKLQGVTKKTTVICEDVWIGANVSIMSGVTVGAGSIIAANSCVTKDVPPGVVFGGVPAQQIKTRKRLASV